MGGGRNDKKEMVAGDRLLAWEGGNHANVGTSGPCVEGSSIEHLLRCDGIKGSRVAKIAKGWERWCEGGKTKATQSMKTVKKAEAASLETEVTSLRGKRPIVGLVGTVDVIKKMVGEGQEVISSPVEDARENLSLIHL